MKFPLQICFQILTDPKDTMWSFMCRVWFVCRMDDGRLLDYLMNHDELMEEKVAFYIRDTMEALQYLHNCRVAHLDIKVRRELCYYSVLSYREFQLHRQEGGAVRTPKRWSLNGQALSFRPIDQRKDLLTCSARSDKRCIYFLHDGLVLKAFLDLMKEKEDVWDKNEMSLAPGWRGVMR